MNHNHTKIFISHASADAFEGGLLHNSLHKVKNALIRSFATSNLDENLKEKLIFFSSIPRNGLEAGDRMLVRSGILPKAFRDDVLIHTGDNPNGDPNLVLNFDKIAADSAIWSDSIVMNYYTQSPYSHLDSIGASLAVRQFAEIPYDNTYMQRVANIYIPKDSLITDNAPTNLADSISLVRGRFLLNHDNGLLFKDLLPYVEHREDNHPVAKILPLFGGNYKLSLLHDFLIQFAVIAMFIGIFIQMIFEEKNVTEA